jgi:hypothetical protein
MAQKINGNITYRKLMSKTKTSKLENLGKFYIKQNLNRGHKVENWCIREEEARERRKRRRKERNALKVKKK